MNSNNFNLLDFQYFSSVIGQPIIIDENTLFFKSYDLKYKSLKKNRPSYFESIDNATKYIKSGRKLGIFSTIKKLKLLDIRYASQIINNLILLRKNNDFENIIKGYMTLSLSFGLVSLYKQLNLYKMRYSEDINSDTRYEKMMQYYNDYESKKEKELFQNPLELQGIRIGEINNDVESTFILKEIFENFFDGIIFPVTFSPYFEDNNIQNEILLFNPINYLIELNIIPKNIISIDMNEHLIKHNINLFTIPYFIKDNETTYRQYYNILNNKLNKINYIYEKNNLINKYYTNKKKINDLLIIKNQGIEFKKLIEKNILNNNTKKIRNNIMYEKNNLINYRK